MKSIDFKSLLIGILGTLLVIACSAATVNIKPQSHEVGTYSISCTGTIGAHKVCLVLDTRNGKIVGNIDPNVVKYNMALVDKTLKYD